MGTTIDKAGRKRVAQETLTKYEVDFSKHNNDEHLIITCGDGTKIDFWPSTDKWMVRGTKHTKYTLIALLEKITEHPARSFTLKPSVGMDDVHLLETAANMLENNGYNGTADDLRALAQRLTN